MVKALARRLFARVQQKQKEPWAMLEVAAIEDGGKIKMSFDYNDAFLAKIKSMGFQAETDEDTVQLFFTASALRPMTLAGDEAVQSDAHPTLSEPQNVLKQ